MTGRQASILRALGALGLAAMLAACQGSSTPKQLTPVPSELINKMKQLGMKETGQILIRVYKESSELEVWKERADGRFSLLKTYAICKWSGELGPKVKEGDKQAPEGFYTVTPAQMNPNSSYYLSFNIGYPNAFDRSLGRTGSNLMVHGACSSAGCYSMTDESAGELFALARDSFRGGQRNFQIQAFPFRMTAENMARHANSPHMPFWRMLKVGADQFEVTRKPPKVDVCNKAYVFNADAGGASFDASAACPPYSVPEWITTAVAAKQADDEKLMAAAVADRQSAAARAAAQQAAAEAKAAEKARAIAERGERGERPSLISRIFGNKEEPPAVPRAPAAAEPTPATGAVEPIPTAAPAATLGEAPTPKKKPKVSDEATASIKAPPTPPTPKAPAASAAKAAPAEAVPVPETASGTATASEATPAAPPNGAKWVKRKLDWPEDEDDPG